MVWPKVIRKYKEFFLIVCEDEGTEPAYYNTFQALFPENTLYLRTVGTGKGPLGVVEQSIKEKRQFKEKYFKTVDYVWSVFDKDDADLVPANKKKFETAFAEAAKEDINLAYSNEVFELWLLLHFQEVSALHPLPRTQVYEALGQHIDALSLSSPVVYTKKKIAKENRQKGHAKPIYINGGEVLAKITLEHGDEATAIKRAEQLHSYHKKLQRCPIYSNPCTQVYLLVRQLRELIAYYNY